MIVATKYSVHQIAPYKLLFSNAQTMKRKHSPRRNLMIHLSRDDGITWPIQPTIEYGSSAYSDLAILSDGTILYFYESGLAASKIKRTREWAYANLSIARFNLAWVEGKPRQRNFVVFPLCDRDGYLRGDHSRRSSKCSSHCVRE